MRYFFFSLIVAASWMCQVGMAQEKKPKKRDVMGDFRREMGEIQWISRNPSLLAELQLTDDQVKTLEDTGKNFDQLFKQIFEGRDEDIAEIRRLQKQGKKDEVKELWREFEDQIAKLATAQNEAVTKVLLPHQLERLNQVRLRQVIHRRDPLAEPFTTPLMLADRLDLSSDEKRELKKATRAARLDYYKELEQLKKKTNDRILESLPPEARKQLQDLIGEDYDLGRAHRDAVSKWKKIGKQEKGGREESRQSKRETKRLEKKLNRASP